MNIVIIGLSGSGKGTQAKILQDKYNLCHISTGSLFREYIKKGTEDGIIANQYIQAGKWVPIEITQRLLYSKIKDSKDAKGFILDGYPRTLEQAKTLELKIDLVLNLKNNMSGLVKRLTNRRNCNSCGEILSTETLNKEGKCPICSGEVYQRPEDNEKAIMARFNSFETETKPVIDFYNKQGIVHDIEADKSIEEVTEQIEQVMTKWYQ